MKWISVFLLLSIKFSPAMATAVVPLLSGSHHSTPVSESACRQTDSLSPLKMNKADFLERYGTNDTSRALIRYYFFRGKGYRQFIWLPFLFATPFIVGGALLLRNATGYKSSLDEFSLAIPIAFLLIFGTAGAALIWGTVSTVRYVHFRKKLMKSLDFYRVTGKVDRRISRSTLFRVALRGEPGTFPWKQPKPAPRAARR